jgi:cytosine/adenosine deaminase-related metal-dependent hydrolase
VGDADARRVLVEHLDFVLTVDDEDSVLRDATIAVEDGRITALGPSSDVTSALAREPTDVVLDGRRKGLVPGLIDAHVHLSETLSRGVFPDDVSTTSWVFDWAKPFYAHVSPEDELVSALLGAAEMLRAGTTCFLDMGSQHDPGITARAAARAGIRGIVGRHAADRRPEVIPPHWPRGMLEHHFFPDAETALATLERCVRDWDGFDDGRIRCWVNIEGKEPCSAELHVGARALAERLGVGTTYHLASSLEEARASARRHGAWPVTRIAQLGGLGPNLVLAHAVALRDEEVALLAEHGAHVAFCPSTSLKLAKGATRIGKYPELMRAGVIVVLGTDGVSAGGNLNLMRQIHLAAGLFKDARVDPQVGGARRALRMATADCARALGLSHEIGTLEVGKRGDFVVFDLDHPEWTPFGDPYQALVWSATPASIAETWVDGRRVFDGHRVTGLDEAALRAEARERAAAIVGRAGLGELRADVMRR